MFRILIFNLVFLLRTRDILSVEYRNVCQLFNKSQISFGLNTPSNTLKQKHFLIVQNYFCELEAKYDSNERSQFGITFGFKSDKHCQRSNWLYPKIPQNQKGGHPYQCAFGVRSGSEEQNWSNNLIGLISVWTNHINYTVLPMGSESLDLINTISTIPIKFKDFLPTFAYNVYSRQNLKSIVFFEQKFRKLIQKWDLSVQVLNIFDGEVQNVTDEAVQELEVNLSPNTNLRNPLSKSNLTNYLSSKSRQNEMQSKTYIPKAILQTDRTLKIAGLFGIQIPADRSDPKQPNGTIILFKKHDPENYLSLWYCVTPEYSLSEECKSPENYKLFIDCKNEVFDYIEEEEEQNDTTLGPQVEQTNKEFAETVPNSEMSVPDAGKVDATSNTTSTTLKKSSSKLLVGVILIIVIIIVLVTCIAVLCPNDPLKGYERRLVHMKTGDKNNPNNDNKGIEKSSGKSDGKSDAKSDSKSDSKENSKSDSVGKKYAKTEDINAKSTRSAIQ